MITENARVVLIENNQTWIETQRKSACGQCSANMACGTSVLSKVIGNRLSKMKAINSIDARVGDEVVVGLNESSFLKGAFIVYMLPLLYLFIFSFVGHFVSGLLFTVFHEAIVILFAMVGFYLGMRRVNSFSRSIDQDEKYQPVILTKLSYPHLNVK